MKFFSLRLQLIFPFVFLVILVSGLIGWVSYRAAEDAVHTLSERVLMDMADRIGNATERHLSGAQTALNSVDPDPLTVPKAQVFSDDLVALEARYWSASGLFMDVNNYVYYAGEDGRFVGVNRISKDFVELYLQAPGAKTRKVYSVDSPGDRAHLLRTDNFDAHIRPWYKIAAKQRAPTWSPLYNDFTSKEPTITLAKSIYRADGTLAGVMATDVTLKMLTDFLRTLKVSANGVAFVIDGSGFLIATSGQELPFKMINGMPEPMLAGEMQTSLIRDAWAKIHEWKNRESDARTPLSREFVTASGAVDIAAIRIGKEQGVDWVAVVAVPRSDFMGGVTRNFMQGLLIAAICVVIALLLGLWILNGVLQDIQKLTNAAKKIGDGEPLSSLDIKRRDEIGQLALTFCEMARNLHIDKLTGVCNRSSLIEQFSFLKRQPQKKRSSEQPVFALLFIDLDNFKPINDVYGHDAGDRVLITVATRLEEAVRATDVVARYGGDEFVLLLKGAVTAGDIDRAEKKIRDIVEQPIVLERGVVQVGMSSGWAMFPEDGDDVDTLLKVADQRMFEAKKNRKAAQ